MTTKESLLYAVADTVQIPLHPFVGGYLGKAKQLVKVGPWTLPLEPAALSDALTPEHASFFVHVSKDLWLYVVASDGGAASYELVAHVINGGLVGLNNSTLKSFGTGVLADTKAKLTKGIVSSYSFSTEKQVWESLN